jgi:transposase
VALDREDEARAHKTRPFGVESGGAGWGEGTLTPGEEPYRELPTKWVFLPSYSPELNPAERIFEEVRRRVEGRVYDSL